MEIAKMFAYRFIWEVMKVTLQLLIKQKNISGKNRNNGHFTYLWIKISGKFIRESEKLEFYNTGMLVRFLQDQIVANNKLIFLCNWNIIFQNGNEFEGRADQTKIDLNNADKLMNLCETFTQKKTINKIRDEANVCQFCVCGVNKEWKSKQRQWMLQKLAKEKRLQFMFDCRFESLKNSTNHTFVVHSIG